jgi:hypothetical protein
VADLETRIERELIAAAGRSGRLRYARSPLPRPTALATAAASAVLALGAIAAGVRLVNESPAPGPAIDERPAATPSPLGAELRRSLKSPKPAPAELAALYSSLADGNVHEGPPVPRATVTIHGTSTGGCIAVMPDGALGPGGSCFTVKHVKAQSQWLTLGGILVVLVPDDATDISVETPDGTRRPTTATSNLVVAHASDTVRYSASGNTMTVSSRARSR